MGKLICGLLMLLIPFTAVAAEGEVGITKDILEVVVETPDGPVTIKRNQDTEAVIEGYYAKTSRKCPPFCIQEMIPAPGVTPVGEREVLDLLAKKDGILVDARTEEWHLRETIPGSRNIPYVDIASRLDELGCAKKGDGWDCAQAKKVILYCNGAWCGQSPMAIRSMLRAGFPVEKTFYYRGGMQAWKILGLTTVEGSL